MSEDRETVRPTIDKDLVERLNHLVDHDVPLPVDRFTFNEKMMMLVMWAEHFAEEYDDDFTPYRNAEDKMREYYNE